MLRTFTIEYQIHGVNASSTGVASYNAGTFGEAVEMFQLDQIEVTSNHIKEHKLLEQLGGGTEEQIYEGNMSPQDIIRNYNKLIEEGHAHDFNVMVII